MAEKVTIILPMLPSSLPAQGKTQRHRQQAEEKKWQDYIASEWALLGKPKFNTIRVTLIFSFPEKGNYVLSNYLASGSKLVGDAVKGSFIPDDGPENLTGWSFLFQFGVQPQTTIIIESVGQKDEEWQRPLCSLYESCNAPMCPLDQASLNGIWYPGEEICRSKLHGDLSWVKAQRKIGKCSGEKGGYFTLAMLHRNCIVKKGFTGLDLNGGDIAQLKKWLDDHPEKREMSDEEKTVLRQRAKDARFWEKKIDDRGAGQPTPKGVRTRF